jgi:hypothetical protein
MLTAQAIELIRESVNAQLGPRATNLAAAVNECDSRFASHGAFNSSRRVVQRGVIACQELRIRAEIIWGIIRQFRRFFGEPNVTGKSSASFPRAREAGDYRLGFTTGASNGGERSTAAQCAGVGRTDQAAEGERAIGAGFLPARGDQPVDALWMAIAAAVGSASAS